MLIFVSKGFFGGHQCGVCVGSICWQPVLGSLSKGLQGVKHLPLVQVSLRPGFTCQEMMENPCISISWGNSYWAWLCVQNVSLVCDVKGSGWKNRSLCLSSCRYLGTRFSGGPGSAGLMAGSDGLRGLFQRKRFCAFMILSCPFVSVLQGVPKGYQWCRKVTTPDSAQKGSRDFVWHKWVQEAHIQQTYARFVQGNDSSTGKFKIERSGRSQLPGQWGEKFSDFKKRYSFKK